MKKMHSTFFSLLAIGFFGTTLDGAFADKGDWPWWRGLDRNGKAPAGQNPPLEFSPNKNCLWSSALPGRSHGSAIVVGSKVMLAVGDPEKETQSVLCLDRDTGKTIWNTVVHRGGLPKEMNKKASHASSTPACDGDRIYINFLNGGAVHTTALDMDGKQLWQTKISDYIVHQGYGSSPAVYQSLVIVSADNKGGGAICGLARETGREIWRVDRPEKPNYPSPIIHTVGGRDQLLFTGVDRVSSFDPLTGKTLWEIEGATTECVTSIVTDGERVFTSGGYPKNHVSAVAADGSGEIVWEKKSRVYVPSMLVHNKHLYAVMDGGVAVCWDSATGEQKWKARLGGNFTSSPVLVGERIYAANESGVLFVYSADPSGLKVLRENDLDGEVYATPTIVGSRIFLRVAHYKGEDRKERLYCFGK